MVYSTAFGGLKVTVWSNGRPLEEYHDSTLDNSGTATSRYVKCTSDTAFEIVVEFGREVRTYGDVFNCWFSVDGKYTDSVVKYNYELKTGPSSYKSTGVRVANGKLLPYRFAALERNEALPNIDAASVKHLGCITVQFAHARLTSKRDYVQPRYDGTSVTAVSEKSLKGQAVSNVVSFGEPVLVSARSTVSSEMIGSYAAVIKFHYRSEEDLKVMQIIPRTPSPAPIEERDAEQLTADQIRELQERVRRFEAAQASVDIKPNVKRERESDSAQSNKRARTTSQKVVLVLDDDDDSFREVAMPPEQRAVDSTRESPAIESIDLS